jgi:hypothetical protein
MAAQIFRPVPIIRIVGAEGTSVISEVYSYNPYLSNPDTPQFEVVNLNSEYDHSPEEVSSSTGGSISDRIEYILSYLRDLKAKIESPTKVRDYLYYHPEIAELCKEVSIEIYQHFDFRAKLYLEIENDEVPNSEYLVMYLRVPEYDDSVMDYIRKIRSGYYDLLDNAKGWFLLTTDFCSPEQ